MACKEGQGPAPGGVLWEKNQRSPQETKWNNLKTQTRREQHGEEGRGEVCMLEGRGDGDGKDPQMDARDRFQGSNKEPERLIGPDNRSSRQVGKEEEGCHMAADSTSRELPVQEEQSLFDVPPLDGAESAGLRVVKCVDVLVKRHPAEHLKTPGGERHVGLESINKARQNSLVRRKRREGNYLGGRGR